MGGWYYHPGVFIPRLIDTIIGLIEAVLALRLILQLLGASASSQFVAWVFQLTEGLIGPFAGAFPFLYLGGFTVDLNAILAMIAYAIFGWLLIRVFSFVFVPSGPARMP